MTVKIAGSHRDTHTERRCTPVTHYRLHGVPLPLPVVRDVLDGQVLIEQGTDQPVQRWRTQRAVTTGRATERRIS